MTTCEEVFSHQSSHLVQFDEDARLTFAKAIVRGRTRVAEVCEVEMTSLTRLLVACRAVDVVLLLLG